jgi:hypothetical protein
VVWLTRRSYDVLMQFTRAMLALAGVVLVVSLDAPALAEPERAIHHFIGLDVIADAHSFEYALTTTRDGKATTKQLRVKLATSGRMEASWDTETDKTSQLDIDLVEVVQLPRLGTKGPSVSSWLLQPDLKPGPLQTVRMVLDHSKKFELRAPRSHWEDGFVHQRTYGRVDNGFKRTLTFANQECSVGKWKGRQAVMKELPFVRSGPTAPARLEDDKNTPTIEVCLSPDVPVPLRWRSSYNGAAQEVTLAAYAGPPPLRGPLAWHCDANCGPKPRRPPRLGAPAPAFRASRWIPDAPVAVASSKGKVLIVHACFLDEPACRTIAQQIDAIRSKHPEVLAVTLASGAPHVVGSKQTTEELLASFAAKHPIGLQTAADATANEDAYDLDGFPIAWVIVDGKLEWYGMWIEATWNAGNRIDAETLAEQDPAALSKAVEAALATSKPAVTASAQPDARIVALAKHQLKMRWSRIRACYTDRLATKPGLAGKLSVTAVFASDGKGRARVTEAKLASSTVADDVVESCVVAVVQKMGFMVPSSSQDFKPFRFSFPVVFTK